MNSNHLYSQSKPYEFCRTYARFMHSLYYREICIVSPENVPASDAVIFSPNHQNALMDALAILINQPKQPVFMARSDIFAKKRIARVLNFLKIIPVFRIRDGFENLQNNDETFRIALNVLQNNQPVALMPEGNHGDQRRLRPLKKGLMRLAFQAQENFKNDKKVKIVPIGIHFSHYSNFRSRLLVIYGRPIDVSEYLPAYTDNAGRGLQDLRERLETEMKKYMLDIDTDEHYELILQLKDIVVPTMVTDNDYYSHFKAEKDVTDKLTQIAREAPEKLADLRQITNEYVFGLKRLNLRSWLFDAPDYKRNDLIFDLLRYVLFAPVFLLTAIFNAVPFFVPIWLANKVKDPQFRSSFKFAIGFVAFPLFYLLILAAAPLPFFTRVLLVLTMPLLGVLSFDYFIALKKFAGKIRFMQMERNANPELQNLKGLRKKIIGTVQELIK
jgi:1-acyl-sn-glycerol-3-phosphate acyltransferase